MQTSIHSTAELAARLGLSRWTVSRALNRHPEVNAETAARVWREAESLGFSPSILGRGLQKGRTDLVGVLVPDLEQFYLTRKVSVLRERIEKAGLQGVVQITNSSTAGERTALERFAAMRCAGVVNVASQLKPEDPAIRRLAAGEIPLVQIDPMSSDDWPRVVRTDRAAALRDSVMHLAKLGHRKIAVLGVNPATHYGRQRWQGLMTAARTLKWKPEKCFRFYEMAETSDAFAAGVEMARQYLRDATPRAKAIIAMNDQIALGALRQLEQSAIHVPRDVSLVGYDNSDFSPYTAPALTTFDAQVDQLMHKAMDLLFTKSPKTMRASVKPRLVVRASTAKPSR